MEDEFQQWRRRMLSKEVSFLPPFIAHGANFLTKEARNDHGTWGTYKGFRTDLHASTLCIQALNACDAEYFYSVTENAYIALIPYIQESHKEFGFQELVDSLNLLWELQYLAEEQEQLREALTNRLKNLKSGFGWGYPEPSVTASAEALLALRLSSKDNELGKTLLTMSGFQRAEDGSWPVTPGGEGSLIASSLMLQLLSRTNIRSVSKHRAACVSYFRNYLEVNTWQAFSGENRSLFTASLVLRAIASVRDFPYELIAKGVEFLYGEVNSDGGWGERKGGISSVEMTSLCLLALCAAGENRFVPAPLAISSLGMAANTVTRLNKEKRQLASDIEAQVKKEINNVINQRDKLQKQVQQLESEKKAQAEQLAATLARQSSIESLLNNIQEISNLQTSNSESLRTKRYDLDKIEFILRRQRTQQRIRFLILETAPFLAAVTTLVVGFSNYPLLKISSQWLSILTNGLIFTTSAVLIYFLTKAITKSIQPGLYFPRPSYINDPSSSLVIDELLLVMTEWPPSKREDFLFRMSRLPDDFDSGEFEDYARYISDTYSDSDSQKRNLRRIMPILLRFPPSARNELIDMLRSSEVTIR